VILEMAQSWLDLAERAAEEAQTSVTVDEAAAGGRPSDEPR
jgi:hypothetical protein